MKPHIFLFHGPDTYSSSRKIRTWLSEFAKKHGVNNSMTLDCEDAGANPVTILHNFLSMHSLFGYTKLAVLKNVWGKNAKPTAEYLAEHLALLPSTYFIVIHAENTDARTVLFKKIAALEKEGRATVEHFDIPSGSALEKWIQEYVAKLGGSITRDTIHYLVSRIEGTGYKEGPTYDLWQLSHELEKLSSASAGRAIEKNDIDSLLSLSLNAHVFDLTDAILTRSTPETYRLIHSLMTDTSSQTKSASYGMLTLLKTQLRQLLIVKDLAATSSDTEIATALSWNPKRVWVMKKKLDRVSQQRLEKMYHTILSCESEFFFSPISPLTTIDLLAHRLLNE